MPLAEMAKLRRDNPEVSLSELADMTDPPLTRSGVNHRLKRLVEIAGGIGADPAEKSYVIYTPSSSYRIQPA